MKKVLVAFAVVAMFAACNDNAKTTEGEVKDTVPATTTTTPPADTATKATMPADTAAKAAMPADTTKK